MNTLCCCATFFLLTNILLYTHTYTLVFQCGQILLIKKPFVGRGTFAGLWREKEAVIGTESMWWRQCIRARYRTGNPTAAAGTFQQTTTTEKADKQRREAIWANDAHTSNHRWWVPPKWADLVPAKSLFSFLKPFAQTVLTLKSSRLTPRLGVMRLTLS